MKKIRTIFNVFCIVLAPTLVLSCGGKITTSTNCGDPLTLSNTPAKPILGGYPAKTDKTAITLFGTKSVNTSIVININHAELIGMEAVPPDCLTTWAADVILPSEGTNTLEIFSLNRIGAAGPSTTISIVKQALPLPPPSRKILGRLLCDINGDGYDDVIVGSYENSAVGVKVGRVFVYFGGATGPSTTPSLVLTGESANDHFGISAACAGDVNGDGFGDIIVGAFLNSAGGENAGRAYIYFGGNNTDNNPDNKIDGIPDLILTGQAADDQFGTSVSGAGDVNGDGYDDVVVGAYRNDGGGANTGRAYIYYGGRDMDNLPDVVLTGQGAGDQFGIRVAWAGDVNGDTYDDVIVGADRVDVGDRIDAGKAYIFLGSPNMAGQNAGQADVILEGSTQDEAFASVAGAGDLNHDGYSDVVVGASAYTVGTGPEICIDFKDNDNDGLIDRQDPDCYLGRAYIFLGGRTMPPSKSANNADFILERPPGADGFGFSVASAGDVNGDGFSDLLVGAFLSDRVAGGTRVEDAGRAYLYFGKNPFHSTQVLTSADVTILGQASPGISPNFIPLSGQFGFALSGAGRLNNDDLSDIVIGAYLFDTGILFTQSDVGRVYLFYGRTASAWPSVIDLNATSASQTITGFESDPFTGRASDPFGPDSGFGVSVQ